MKALGKHLILEFYGCTPEALNDKKKIETTLADFRAWSESNKYMGCRLVQYSGVDFVGAIDVDLDQIENQIKGLLCEGFYVDWNVFNNLVYLRVYEYGGPEPTWDQTIKEEPLADVAAILKKAGFDE